MKQSRTIRLLMSTIIFMLISTTASAFEGRAYVGVQLAVGWVDLNDTKDKVDLIDLMMGVPETNLNNNGFAGRVYAGYRFLPYLGFEVGYAKYSNSTSDVNDFSDPFSTIEFSATNRVSSIDALAVIALPVTHKISLNAKAGMAYVMNDYDLYTSFNGDLKEILSVKARTINPKFAVGADYYLTDSVALGLAYEITLGSGAPSDINTDIGNTDFSPKISMASVNLKYKF